MTTGSSEKQLLITRLNLFQRYEQRVLAQAYTLVIFHL